MSSLYLLFQTEDVFAKLKSGEGVELENLKQLYDKIPDITKTEIIKETEDWSTSVPSTETVLQVRRYINFLVRIFVVFK